MRKKDFNKYFKTAVLMMALIFFTAQAVQADYLVSEDKIVTSDQNGDDAAGKQTLDGSTDSEDVANGEGDTLLIEEGGEVVSDDGHGVKISNDDNLLINYGNISMSGISWHGVEVEGYRNTIFNYGLISGLGEGSDGIYLSGDYHTIFNYGGIEATRNGIFSEGNNVQITNFGWIESAWDGISSNGLNASINNYGAITAHHIGIGSWGEDAKIYNYGSITSTAGQGIRSEGEDAKIYNYGSITAEWDGIYLSGNNGTIDNYGSITAKDYGIWISPLVEEGATNTINNYGSIHSDNYAIVTKRFYYDAGVLVRTTSGNETVNLFSSSDITGDIDLGSGDDTLNYYVGAKVKGRIDLAEGEDTANVIGTGRPAVAHTLTFHGAENININNIIGVRKGNTVITIDPSIQSVKAPALNSFTTGLHNVITDRLDTELKNKSSFWADSFNSYHERDSENLVSAYDHQYNGAMFGYDITNENLRFGFMAGLSDGNTEGKYNTFETDSDSYFGGIYGEYNFGIFRLATSLLGGYEDHEDERKVFDNKVGYEMAKADYNSWFFSPSIKLSRSFNLSERWILEPSATAVYSIGWYDSYNEKGTVNSNLGIDDRTIDTFNGKLKLKAAYSATDKIRLGFYGGATVRYTDDEDIDGNIGGTGFSYSAMNDDSVYGGQFGAYIDVAIKDNFDLNFKIQHNEMSGDEKRDFFAGGFTYKF